MPSPMEAYYPQGIDNENEKLRQVAYLQKIGRSTYPMQSPSGANSSRILVRNGKKETEQPSMEMVPNLFQTPTSRQYPTIDMSKYNLNRDETRPFLPCVKDIAVNRAVYNQQRQGNMEGMTSPNYFYSSPYALTNNNFQNQYRYNYANHQNAGSFGASPGFSGVSPGIFGVRSPYTANNMLFNNQPVINDQREGSDFEHSSSNFNVIPENIRVPQNIMSGQDSKRQYDNFIRNLKANRNCGESPGPAFDFSNKSGIHHSSKMSNNSYYRVFALFKLPKI
jgi:hypothetical protein